jgi:hypothetical protein
VQLQDEPVNISQLIKQLGDETPTHGIEIREIIERMGQQGLLIVIMVLSFPFLLPVSIPGTSTPFGTLIILICLSMFSAKPLRLPRRLESIRIRQRHMVMIASRAVVILSKIEKWSKPRMYSLTATKTLVNIHLVGIILNAICLMVPLPLPLANAIPAYGIVFMTLGLLRRDGGLIVLGYIMLLSVLIYFTIVYILSVLGIRSFMQLWSF